MFIFASISDMLPELRIKYFNYKNIYDLARLNTILHEHFCLREIIKNLNKAKKSLLIGFMFTSISDVLAELRVEYKTFNHTTFL